MVYDMIQARVQGLNFHEAVGGQFLEVLCTTATDG